MSQPPPPEMPEAVSVVDCRQISFRPTVTAIGTVRAPRSITVRNEIAGQVIQIPIQTGQVVEKGDLLIELDKSVENAQLQSAVARQRMAKSMVERTRRSARANASSGNEVDQSEAEMLQADAEIKRLEAIIEKKTLLAPFRATVGLVDTYGGQYLSEGTTITMLQGIDSYVYVDFMMPQEVADAVTVNQAITMVSTTQRLTATLVALDAQSDRMTRNLLGRARLDNPPAYLQPNDSIKVEVAYGSDQSMIAVPSEAVRRSPEGAFVFIEEVDKEGIPRAIARPIMPRQTIGRDVVIAGGLRLGDRVVVDGSFKLRDGNKIAATMPVDDPLGISKTKIINPTMDDEITAVEVSP